MQGYYCLNTTILSDTYISTTCFGLYGHRQVGYSIRWKKLHNITWYSTNISMV